MREKVSLILIISILLISSAAESQVIYRRMPRSYPRPHQKQQRSKEDLPKFQPRLNLSLGYGYPNLDQNFMPQFYDAGRGTISQMGPINGALNYQFSRTMGIGVIVTHGTVNAPYYDYNSSSPFPAFYLKLDNWSFMLDVVRYFPVNEKITPYLRTAIGVNSWNQEYSDANGNKLPIVPIDLPAFAYQLSFGIKLNLSQNAGIFVEGGYGKYILNGGLAFKM